MKYNRLKRCCGFMLVPLVFVGSLSAETFFKADFDDGVIGSEGKWAWEAPSSLENVYGMMVAEGDIYSVSNAISFQGGHALRLDFAGRNGWCNACGFDTHIVSASAPELGSTSLTVDSEDFSAIFPSNLRKVFNKTDRWAAWSVSDVNVSQLSFVDDAPVANAMGGNAFFKQGDEIQITKACGVDGVIGGDIKRRSDCDRAINYLEGIASSDVGFGGTLSKRFYLYIHQDAELPNVGLKLGYSVFEQETAIAVLDVDRGETLMVQTPSTSSRYAFPGFQFERGRWYYLEETFIRETSDGAENGIYRLYLSDAGEVSTQPLVERTGVNYGVIKDITIIGNWQHFNNASGYIYIDSVEVADHYIGPIDYKAPSNPPPFESIKGAVIQ